MASNDVDRDVAAELRKIGNLIALDRLRGLSMAEQATLLSLAGYSNAEIASLTGSTEGSVRATLSRVRRRGPAATEA
jgi:DNA-directed RNA polymerase specialized sigma24 family protein